MRILIIFLFLTFLLSGKENLLALSWQNAFCETHRYKKECKRDIFSLIRKKDSEREFVLHGLWPQPKNNVYCNLNRDVILKDKRRRWKELPNVDLDTKTAMALAKVMPGFKSQLHKHEWIKHGTCYGTNANQYFSDAISLVEQVNRSPIGRLFTENIGKKITLKEVRAIANKSFGRGTGDRIELRCHRGLITELWLHLGGDSKDLATLLRRGKKIYSRCKYGLIDKAEFNYKAHF